jgi:hypothetical protein
MARVVRLSQSQTYLQEVSPLVSLQLQGLVGGLGLVGRRREQLPEEGWGRCARQH